MTCAIAIRAIACRARDVQSHALPPARLTLLGLSLALLSSCTLIQRPEPVTTLQLSLADANLTWPAALATGKVDSVSALRSNRILVIDGARLMQHDGLRWVETPAIMFAEQLRGLWSRSGDAGAANASLDIWLTEFNLRLDTSGSREVAAAAHASLRCADSERSIAVTPASARSSLSGDDPQALADAFANASAEVVAGLLSQAETLSAGCKNP